MNKKFFLAWMMLCMIALHVRAELVPTRLRCEQMDNPFTVDVLNPRLSWINKVNDEAVQGERQTAYRICVASSREKLLAGDADIWDTGKKMSDQSVLVPFQGNELVSGGTYWWRVKVWNKDGHESEWSEPAYWGWGCSRLRNGEQSGSVPIGNTGQHQRFVVRSR
jgi:alpha-L-rhamnosidase